jgi:hypothetical protein
MSYPVTLVNMDKNVKRRKSRLRITSPPAPTRLTQCVQLALSALIYQDVYLSSVLISTPHTLRLFHVLQCRTQQRVKKVRIAAISPRITVPQQEKRCRSTGYIDGFPACAACREDIIIGQEVPNVQVAERLGIAYEYRDST